MLNTVYNHCFSSVKPAQNRPSETYIQSPYLNRGTPCWFFHRWLHETRHQVLLIMERDFSGSRVGFQHEVPALLGNSAAPKWPRVWQSHGIRGCLRARTLPRPWLNTPALMQGKGFHRRHDADVNRWWTPPPSTWSSPWVAAFTAIKIDQDQPSRSGGTGYEVYEATAAEIQRRLNLLVDTRIEVRARPRRLRDRCAARSRYASHFHLAPPPIRKTGVEC